jgi:hypothetical protein
MSLRDKAYWIVENAAAIAGDTHLVEDCTDNSDEYNLHLVTRGEKPLCDPPRYMTLGEIRALPQVEGLELAAPRVWLCGDWHIEPLFGKPEHIEAYVQACKLRNRGMDPEADALFGLAFGYPEDKIARFVLNGIERYGVTCGTCGETISETIVWTHVGSTMPYIARFTTTLANGKSYMLSTQLSRSGATVEAILRQVEMLSERPGPFCRTVQWIAEKRVRKGVKDLAQYPDNQDRLRTAYDRTLQLWAESVLAERP